MTQTKTNKLTDAQKRFALEYVKDSNATAAAVRAGYSESNARSTGCRLRKDPMVKAEIERLQEKIEEKALVDALWVQKKWKAVVESCTQEVLAYSMTGAPLKGRDGKQVYKMLDANSARNTLSDVAKFLKMFDKADEKPEDDTFGVLLIHDVEGAEQWTKE